MDHDKVLQGAKLQAFIIHRNRVKIPVPDKSRDELEAEYEALNLTDDERKAVIWLNQQVYG